MSGSDIKKKGKKKTIEMLESNGRSMQYEVRRPENVVAAGKMGTLGDVW